MKQKGSDYVAESWSELSDILFADSWNSQISRYRSDFAYRGVADKSYGLETSFIRLCGNNKNLEYHLIRNFQKYAPLEDVKRASSIWHWITLAQHHGLPTRLLDWTYSPFVALHFATVETDKYDKDAAIWCVDYVAVNKMLPPPLIDVMNDVGSNAFTIGMLDRALGGGIDDIKEYDKLSSDLVLFFEPPSIDERIVNQFAFFSVMSDPTRDLNNWLADHPHLFKRIIIPSELKWEVRDKLDQANMTERVLFPGLDGLTRWLSRHYLPKNNTNL
ncbi:MAG: FRG domain-containing protein [Spirochaetales bacterium]|nr:FRG domain-containing protein [Spirochaetales bacterium]